METTFCELRKKEVINVVDGKILGHIIDMVISTSTCKVLGFLVPGNQSFQLFKKNDNIFIPYEAIISIGEDVILVKLCDPTPNHICKGAAQGGKVE